MYVSHSIRTDSRNLLRIGQIAPISQDRNVLNLCARRIKTCRRRKAAPKMMTRSRGERRKKILILLLFRSPQMPTRYIIIQSIHCPVHFASLLFLGPSEPTRSGGAWPKNAKTCAETVSLPREECVWSCLLGADEIIVKVAKCARIKQMS